MVNNNNNFQGTSEAEPITVIPGTPETEPTDSDAPSANEESELSEPTNGDSSQESTEDESEIFLTPPEEEESDKAGKKSGKKAEKRQSRSRVAPATPEKRVQPAIPGNFLLQMSICERSFFIKDIIIDILCCAAIVLLFVSLLQVSGPYFWARESR